MNKEIECLMVADIFTLSTTLPLDHKYVIDILKNMDERRKFMPRNIALETLAEDRLKIMFNYPFLRRDLIVEYVIKQERYNFTIEYTYRGTLLARELLSPIHSKLSAYTLEIEGLYATYIYKLYNKFLHDTVRATRLQFINESNTQLNKYNNRIDTKTPKIRSSLTNNLDHTNFLSDARNISIGLINKPIYCYASNKKDCCNPIVFSDNFIAVTAVLSVFIYIGYKVLIKVIRR